MMTVQAQYIQAGDILHLGTDATPEDFTAYDCRLEGDDPGTVAVDVGEGCIYFRPREWVLITREA